MDETEIQMLQWNSIFHPFRQITNMKSYDEARKLADKINSALPFSMVTKNYSTISPSLAPVLWVLKPGGPIAYCIICALLIGYYAFPILWLVFRLQFRCRQILSLSIPQMSLTLTGIAGIILSMAWALMLCYYFRTNSEEIKAER